jgi:hypothetical protein
MQEQGESVQRCASEIFRVREKSHHVLGSKSTPKCVDPSLIRIDEFWWPWSVFGRHENQNWFALAPHDLVFHLSPTLSASFDRCAVPMSNDKHNSVGTRDFLLNLFGDRRSTGRQPLYYSRHGSQAQNCINQNSSERGKVFDS